MTEDASGSLLGMTSEIVAAYVVKNHIRSAELPDLITAVHSKLAAMADPAAATSPAPALAPAVPIKRSITEDYIISLEDGRKLKSMKRYLTGLGMTPADYRMKWGLPSDYPMVAPGYAAKRSELARSFGLGQIRRAERSAAKAAALEAAPASDALKKRGRPKKAAE